MRDFFSFYWLFLKTGAARRLDILQNDIAWHLPRWLVYRSSIRLVAHASQRMGNTMVQDIGAMEALAHWEKPIEQI